MRKDVECTFGIMKGRWRILKTGVRLHSTESVDRIWLTYCTFHNMLLKIDGLDEAWDGVRVPTSVWDGKLGDLDPDDVPDSICRIWSPTEIRNHDTTSLGDISTRKAQPSRGADVVAGVNVEEGVEDDTEDEESVGLKAADVRIVRKLSLIFFRSKLLNILISCSRKVWYTGQTVEVRHHEYILNAKI